MKMLNMTSKTQKVKEGNKKCRYSRMCLNLKDYLFKTSRYSYRLTYMNHMVTTNRKPKIDTQKLERKEHKQPLKKIIKPQEKKQREEQNKPKSNRERK